MLPSTPTEQLIAKATEIHQVEDKRGRTIALRKPSFLSQFRMLETVGGELASNQPYMSIVNMLLYVVAIDGETIHPPARKSEVEALISTLDEDGLAAVGDGIKEHWAPPQSEEEARAALKK
jgi:hypothetical protein